MMKEEFCLRAKIKQEDLSSEDYAVIEKVYATHPVIDPVKGKDQITAIFNLPGGMRIIRDMVPTAEKVAEMEDEMRSISRQIGELTAKLDEMKRQYDALKR